MGWMVGEFSLNKALFLKKFQSILKRKTLHFFLESTYTIETKAWQETAGKKKTRDRFPYDYWYIVLSIPHTSCEAVTKWYKVPVKRYKLTVKRHISAGGVMHSMMTIVNSTALYIASRWE